MNLIHRVLLAALIVTQTVQAQQSSLQAYLPADARAIINLNLPSLASKMKWQDIQSLPFFEEALKDAPLQMQEFLKNPASTGINFLGGFYIVLHADTKDKSKSVSYLYGLVADTAKFAATLQQTAPNQKIKTFGKLKLLENKSNAIAWTPEVFVIPMTRKKGMDVKKTVNDTKQLLNTYKTLLTPVANPATTDSRFAALLKEDGDLRLWINRNKEKPDNKSKKGDQALKMLNWGMMQQGNYMAGVLRFENGKAVMQMKSYMNKTMDSLYRLYPSMTLNNNLLKKLPSGQPIALLSFGMSPEMIGALLKTTGVEKIMDSLGQKSSVDPMKVVNSLNGDLTLAVIRAHEYDEKDTVTAALNGLQIFLAASVKNKSGLEPLLNLLQKPKEVKKDEEGNEIKPSGPFGSLKPSFILNDSFFVVSISSYAAEKFLQASNTNETAEMANPYSSHASLFALDIKSIIGFAMQMSKKKTGNNEEMARAFDAFDRIVFYGGKYENGAALSTAEMQFSNKEENSLKQLVKLIETMAAAEMKSKKAKKESEYETGDSPVIDEEKLDIENEEEVPPPPPPPAPKQKAKPKPQKGKK
jgi:hypothetical protein